jgi:hypothetical protein
VTHVLADNWLEANQRYLTAALAEVRVTLEQHARRSGDPSSTSPARPTLEEATTDMPAPAALETLCELFSLSSFERDMLLLCAGVELDVAFPGLCAAAQGDSKLTYPTFSLALAALPAPHWDAISPVRPLRGWRLIEVSGDRLTRSPLRIDERVLHYLAGVQHLDERLLGFVELVPATDDLLPSHRALAEQLATTWSQAAMGSPLPVAQLCGGDEESRRDIAAAACAARGLNLYAISAQALPLGPRELEALLRLWEREAALSSSALLLEWGEQAVNDAARERATLWLVESTSTALIVAGRERRSTPHRPSFALEVPRPTTSEQHALWRSVLGSAAADMNGRVDALVAQFNLSAGAIRSVCAEASGRDGEATDSFGNLLWEACRVHARPRLDDLAQRIEPAADWEDLVLPEAQRQVLRELAVHVRQRTRVYETWGFAAKSARGLGINALFAGPSGTGKTMAAEVLAGGLRLDLYHIDLSSAVSKYIGETEKNLRRIFDAAEGGGAILLFDEADALFGKRSEVKDSHDRYANIEVSYLLQRMEAYRGLAILTTNVKSALDQAFLRRIRFVVQFPFPDAAQRAEIWRRAFPPGTPTEGLDADKLARLNVAGGTIRNIALYGSFLAAETRTPVRMHHLLRAARVEYSKLEKPLTEAEIGGWE